MDPFYTGEPGQRRSDTPLVLPDPVHVSHEEPAGYRPDPGLVTAFNVALLLGQPLLVTGEPRHRQNLVRASCCLWAKSSRGA